MKDGGGWPTAERKAAWREGDGDDRHRSERGREREGARRQIQAERGSERERETGEMKFHFSLGFEPKQKENKTKQKK
jgi:hypothetical protein